MQKKKGLMKSVLSITMAVLLLVTTVMPALPARAEGPETADFTGSEVLEIWARDWNDVREGCTYSNADWKQPEDALEYYYTFGAPNFEPVALKDFASTFGHIEFKATIDKLPEELTVLRSYLRISVQNEDGNMNYDYMTKNFAPFTNGDSVTWEWNLGQETYSITDENSIVVGVELVIITDMDGFMRIYGEDAQLPHEPVPGEFFAITGYNWENGEPMYSPETFRGDVNAIRFVEYDNELIPQTVELFNKTGYELADDVKIYFAPYGGTEREASVSVKFSIWDDVDASDIKIRKVPDNDEHEIAFCRMGNYRIEYKGQSISFFTMTSEIDIAEMDGYATEFLYDHGQNITIVPDECVIDYSVAIRTDNGYGSDGKHQLVKASIDGNDASDMVHYFKGSDFDVWSEDYDFGDFTKFVSGDKIMVLTPEDFTICPFEVCVVYHALNWEGNVETRFKLFATKYIRGFVRHELSVVFNDSEEEARAFQCTALTKEEYYNDSTDWSIGLPLYITYGRTINEAIEVMMEKMESGEIESHEYLQIRPYVALDNEEEVELSQAPQYVSTPENIKGVLLTCQEMDYVVRMKNPGYAVNDGKSVEAWLNTAEPLEGQGARKYFYNDNNGGYYELVGDYENADFTLKDGVKHELQYENGFPYMMLDGIKYGEPSTVCVEYKLPELHVDATTEIRLVGSFQEYDNDQPSIFMNIPEGSAINSYVNGDLYTSADSGKTFNKESVYHSWYSGDVRIKYTVKVDKLEAKTNFDAPENSDITAVSTEMDVDSLFEQLTGTESILSDDEMKNVEAGKNITVTLDVQAVEETGSENLGKEITDEYAGSTTQFLDIDLMYHVGFEEDAQGKNITETNAPVAITVALADNFVDTEAEYVVLREHEGIVEELQAVLNADGTLTFGSNKFSSYAIVKKAKEHVHTQVIIPAVEATCTATGLTEGVKCSSCEEILVAQQIVPKKAHEYVNAATLNDHYKKCKNCSEGVDFERHVYDSDNDVNCNKCGYVRGIKANDKIEKPADKVNAKTYYIVQPGDYLNKIAKKYKMTLAALLKLNPQIKNINRIFVGQKIVVSGQTDAGNDISAVGDFYTVVKGDTLSKIARENKLTLGQVKALNPQITNLNLIFVGQRIKVK